MAAVLVADMETANVVINSAKQGPLTDPKILLNVATRLAHFVSTTNGNTSC